jgi:GntR family negative regulator for fad regulon and positive regulator of fabA
VVRPLTSLKSGRAAPAGRTLPVRPAAHAEQVLVTAILDGRCPAGSNLPSERELALELGVTRPTLREVLKQLDRDGFLTISHGRPTRVNDVLREGGLNVLASLVRYGGPLPEGFVRDLLEVRLALAPAYARAAVERDPEGTISLLAEDRLPADAPGAFASYDWGLHTGLAALSGNPVYGLILNGFASFYEELACHYFEREEARRASRSFYVNLHSAARGRDAGAAERRVRAAMLESLALWAKAETSRRGKRKKRRRP